MFEYTKMTNEEQSAFQRMILNKLRELGLLTRSVEGNPLLSLAVTEKMLERGAKELTERGFSNFLKYADQLIYEPNPDIMDQLKTYHALLKDRER